MSAPIRPELGPQPRLRDAVGDPVEIGGQCGLYLDVQPDEPAPRAGDWVATDAGSRYLVDHVRAAKHHGHRQLQRYNLRCLRLPKHTKPPEDVHVIWLQWYPRGGRR